MDNSTPAGRPIDEHATRIPMRSGLLPCLYVPIAARDKFAIERYVGRIATQLMPKSPDKALLVEAYKPEKADVRLAIWDVPEAVVLHYSRQVWVHVDYRAYRGAYLQAFPDFDLTDLVLDHVMNRRVARLKGFAYLRVCPSREALIQAMAPLAKDGPLNITTRPRCRKRTGSRKQPYSTPICPTS